MADDESRNGPFVEIPPGGLFEGLADVRVELAWNPYDAGLFTDKLYRHVEREEATFRLDATHGSLYTAVAISVASSFTVELISEIGRYLLKRRRVAKDANRVVDRTYVVVVVDGVDHGVEVTDDGDIDELRNLARRKGTGTQATLNDF